MRCLYAALVGVCCLQLAGPLNAEAEEPATQADLDWPVSVAVDAGGFVHVAERGDHRVRRLAPDGAIGVFAGTGDPGSWGDGGPASEASLKYPSGIAVGFDLGPIFDKKLKDEVLQIQKGDRVLVYTDGVVEAMSEDNEEFGEERFLDIVMNHGSQRSGEFINVLVNAMTEHQGEAEQHDDITILTFMHTSS